MPGQSPIDRVIRRDGSTVKYSRERIATAVFKAAVATGRPSRTLADRVARRVERVLVDTYGRHATPSVEDVQDIVENTLMECRLPGIARSYIIYRHQRAKLRAARSQPFEMSDLIPYRKIYEALLWNLDHKCDSVPAMNELIRGGLFPDLVAACEHRYESEVRETAESILTRGGKVRLVIVAGPSSSGKTTTTIKLGEILSRAGARLRTINVDNYFFDLDRHPRDEFGDYDYETPHAIDLKLINRHIAQLLEGRMVRTPAYDFKTGKRTLAASEMRLAKSDVLLLDSLHGLHKDMANSVPDFQKFRLYVETLGQFRSEEGVFMRWADNRLLRRMIRDRQQRNSQPLPTLTHWHYVRASELSHIVPHISVADAVVNTAMPYELPVLRAKLFGYFPLAIRKFKDEPKRQDAYIRAKRVHDFLRPLAGVSNARCIPAKSLLREFIGGSAYKY